MGYDDLRMDWIRERVSAGFNLKNSPECFDELLNRGDGEEEMKILHFLDHVSDDDSPSFLLFYKTIRAEKVEIKVPSSKYCLIKLYFCTELLTI